MSNDIAGIEDNEALLVIGSNTSEAHPVIALRMMRAVKKGAKLLVADPRAIELTKSAQVWLRQRPGTDAALLNAMCHVIIRDDLHDQQFIAERTENFEQLRQAVADCTPQWGEKITGIPAADIEEAARIFARAERAGIYYCMGITQHTSGTDNVRALANLALLTGNLGKPGAGLNPLRGQNNVQGACDTGCVPSLLPGYRSVTDPEARRHFEEIWGLPVPAAPGMTATETMPAILEGRVSGMWIFGENPVISDPNSGHVEKALKKLDFLVVQDIFMTATAELADVVLPAACFAEKEGTFTNTERRVQRVRRAVAPPGQAMDDLSIINMVSARMIGTKPGTARRLDQELTLPNGGRYRVFAPEPQEVFAEISRSWPQLAGVSYQRLDNEGGLQWPCPDPEHPGTPYLFAGSFPIGKAKFSAVGWSGPRECADVDYPLVLTTGRLLYQYHTGTMTRRSRELEEAAPAPFVELHPADAKALGLADGEMVKAVSRRGEITLPALITERVEPGVVFIPFHYQEAAANLLTNDALDPVCKIPEAKVCAVRIEKIAA